MIESLTHEQLPIFEEAGLNLKVINEKPKKKIIIKSPLRYPGGKSKVADIILPMIPTFKEYREPFLGGGSIYLGVKQKYPDGKYWINDLYDDLFMFWNIVKKDIDSLIKQIWEWKTKYPDGKELYKFLKSNFTSFNDIEKASAFFIFNRITFSGTSESGGFSQESFEKRFTVSSITRLENLKDLLLKAKVTNIDYQELLRKEGKDVFIFLDPPYFSAKQWNMYGKQGSFNKNFDHERLAKALKKCKHKWLITYDDSDFIRKLYSSFADIKEWGFSYGMRSIKHKVGSEIFISNY
jgi:DNA adenine methylase